MIHFILYSRSYCHLCEEMLHALQAYGDRYAFSVEVVDVDADPSLIEKYDELVPVLTGIKKGREPVQLCHYFLDAEKLKQFFAE